MSDFIDHCCFVCFYCFLVVFGISVLVGRLFEALIEVFGGSMFCQSVGEFVVFAVLFFVGAMVDALVALF